MVPASLTSKGSGSESWMNPGSMKSCGFCERSNFVLVTLDIGVASKRRAMISFREWEERSDEH